MLKFVVEKYEEIEDLKYPVVPREEPGFIRRKLPDSAPQ